MSKFGGDYGYSEDDECGFALSPGHKFFIFLLICIITGLAIYLTIILTKKQPICPSCESCGDSGDCKDCDYKDIYVLTRGSALYSDGVMFSPNKEYKAVLGSDGNFVIYKVSDNSVKWKIPSYKGPSYLHMQNDGNLVAYEISNGSAYWSSGTSQTDSKIAYIDNNGNLYVGSKKIN